MIKFKKFLNFRNSLILKICEFFKLSNHSNFRKLANFLNQKFKEFYKLEILAIL